MINGKFLLFSCQDRKYAIELHKAKEVRVAENIVVVPHHDETIIGMYNLRGRILQVKDLGRILHHEETILNDQTVLLYLESESSKSTVIVDALLGICSSEEVEWSTSQIEAINSSVIDYFTWKEELIQVLSVDKLVA